MRLRRLIRKFVLRFKVTKFKVTERVSWNLGHRSHMNPSKMDRGAPEATTLASVSDVVRWKPVAPQVCTSSPIRSDLFTLPLYAYWCNQIKEIPRYHRKQGEYVYIAHALWERGYLKRGNRGLGFGVGKEPLVDLFCSYGCEMTASDIDEATAVELGWAQTNQHSGLIDQLYCGISSRSDFDRVAEFRIVDMNHLPEDLRGFDFCYSSCSIEHVGSLDLCKDFLRNSLDTLKPGGLSIHTTEFNLSSNVRTITKGGTIIWRQRDLEEITAELEEAGHSVEPLDFYVGSGCVDQVIDLPPYANEPHIKLEIAGYKSMSFGLIIRKGGY